MHVKFGPGGNSYIPDRNEKPLHPAEVFFVKY